MMSNSLRWRIPPGHRNVQTAHGKRVRNGIKFHKFQLIYDVLLSQDELCLLRSFGEIKHFRAYVLVE